MRRAWTFVRDRYAALDPRSLGLFRIGFGFLLITDLVRRLPVMVTFYTNDGVLSNHYALFRPAARWIFSLYHAFSSPTEVGWAFAASFAVYLCYLVGFHTRAAQIASFVVLCSLHSRNLMLENGGDVIMNLLAAWTMFLPLGRRFSVDALRASWRAHDERTPADLNDRRHPAPPAVAPQVSLAVFALLLQFGVIYAFNAGNKVGPTWREGTAIYYVLHQERLVTYLGVLCRQYLPLFVLKLLTWGTLLIEGAAPILLALPFWQRRARWAFLLSVWALHIGIVLTTNLKQFQSTMMAFPLILLGAADWKWLAARHRRRTGEVILIYDGTCGVCHACARLAKRLDPLAQVEFHANDEPELPAGVSRELAERTMVVIDRASGRTWTRAASFAKLFRVLPGWAPLGWLLSIPGLAQIAGVVYDVFARNRHRVSAAFGLAACGVPRALPAAADAGQEAASGDGGLPLPKRRTPLGWARLTLREAAVAFLLLACGSQLLIENRGPARIFQIRQPDLLAAVVQYPRLFQGWGMFSPDAPVDDGTLVVDGITVDGRHLDPLTGEAPRFEVAPPRGRYPMQQNWCDYANRIRLPGNAAYRGELRNYLLRVWRLQHRPPSEQLVSFEVFWVSHLSPPPGQKLGGPVQRERILAYP